MNNIYNAIQNLYNMDKTTWQEVLAELYNLVSKIENKFDLFELKFGSLLGEQVTRELKKMYDNGSLASLINDVLLQDINEKVDTFKTEVSSQLEQKAKQSDLNTTNTRIDNLIIHSGEGTEKDAELIDGRVSAEGKTFSNIGNHIRKIENGESINDRAITIKKLGEDIVNIEKSRNILDLSNHLEYNISSGGVPSPNSGNVAFKVEISNGKRYGLFALNGNGQVTNWLPRISITDINNNVLSYYIGTSNDFTINNANAKYLWVWNAGWTLDYYKKTSKAMIIEDYDGVKPSAAIEYYFKHKINVGDKAISVNNLNDDVITFMSGNDWTNKNMTNYGDSISAINNGYNGQDMSPDYEYMWGAYVHNYFKMGKFYGRGIGSSTFCWNNQQWFANPDGSYNSRPPASQPSGTTVHRGCFCSWDRIKTMYSDSIRNDIDLILLMGGTNDFGVNNKIGDNPVWSASNTTDTDWKNDSEFYNGGDYDITNFKGAIASTVMKLQARCPNAVIVLLTQLSGQGAEKNPLTNTLGLNPVDYAKAMQEVAQFMSIPCIDVFGTTGINNINSKDYITDGTHPYTIQGNKALARAVIGGLKGIIPRV